MDIETVRTEALRKVGRNVVNFAKIEAGLKLLLSLNQSDGTAQTISEQWRRSQTHPNKKTLGLLVQEFNKKIMVDPSQAVHPADCSGSGISLSLWVTSNNPDRLKAQKRALSAIVAERNRLIHQDLAQLDTTDIEDYRQLIARLDEQNPRLLTHLETLGWILELVREGWTQVLSLLQSPEFLQQPESNSDDAE